MARDVNHLVKALPAVLSVMLNSQVSDNNICQYDPQAPLKLSEVDTQIHFFRLIPDVTNFDEIRAKSRPVLNGYGSADIERVLDEYDPNLPTKLVIHGYQHSWSRGNRHTWIDRMLLAIGSKHRYSSTDTLAEQIHEDKEFSSEQYKDSRGYNVFVFSYDHSTAMTGKSFLEGYKAVAASVEWIGNYFGYFLTQLIQHSKNKVDLSGFHVLSHSLGAHVAGFAGKQVRLLTNDKQKIGYITAIDPAGPCFESAAESDRLDKSDAFRVDVIHANSGGFGITKKFAHNNIVLNNGTYQPGASNGMDSHSKKVLQLFSTRDTECQLTAFRCDSRDQYLRGDCPGCDEMDEDSLALGTGQNNCIVYKHFPILPQPKNSLRDAEKYHWAAQPNQTVVYYTSTSGDEPYCQHIFQITVQSQVDLGNRFQVDVTTAKQVVRVNVTKSQRIESGPGQKYHYTGLITTMWPEKAYMARIRALSIIGLPIEINKVTINVDYRSSSVSSLRKALSSKFSWEEIESTRL